jgi:hypothetical protein
MNIATMWVFSNFVYNPGHETAKIIAANQLICEKAGLKLLLL